MKSALARLLLAACLPLLAARPEAPQDETEHLRQAVGEAGSSPVEFIRGLEAHLAKFPQTARREELERALLKAAMEARDNPRIVRYGEAALEKDPGDIQVLERVTRALLDSDAKAPAEKALTYAARLEKRVREAAAAGAKDAEPRRRARLAEESSRLLSKALVFQARAAGNLGRLEDAAGFASRAFETNPTAETAREIARWLARLGRYEEAVRRLAEAFTIPDGIATASERAADRKRLGELYRKTHPSESGLGDILLEAYDRTSALLAARRERLRAIDPNAGAGGPFEFTLSGVGGETLALASLRGKVVVLDFWATWCGPCRVQKPLYEKVKLRFKDRADVVFLAVSTDEDRSLVKPFLDSQKWSHAVWFDDGLAEFLRVSSIPTTIVLNRKGDIVSRMNGFVPERFVEMLSERIASALDE